MNNRLPNRETPANGRSEPKLRGRDLAGSYDGRVPQAATLVLLHNPHCSTSVHALETLEAAGHEVSVRKYLLVNERLSLEELRSLAKRLEGDPPDALIRRDKRYETLGLDADGLGVDDVARILAEHPALLQRPILDDGQAAMIGRPRDRATLWAAAGRVTAA